MLLGDGQGRFRVLNGNAAGFYAAGDAKGIAEVMGNGAAPLLLVTQNNDSLRAFSATSHANRPALKLQPRDAYAVITLADGKKRRQELHYGSTYLSQSSRYLKAAGKAQQAVIYDASGRSRTHQF